LIEPDMTKIESRGNPAFLCLKNGADDPKVNVIDIRKTLIGFSNSSRA